MGPRCILRPREGRVGRAYSPRHRWSLGIDGSVLALDPGTIDDGHDGTSRWIDERDDQARVSSEVPHLPQPEVLAVLEERLAVRPALDERAERRVGQRDVHDLEGLECLIREPADDEGIEGHVQTLARPTACPRSLEVIEDTADGRGADRREAQLPLREAIPAVAFGDGFAGRDAMRLPDVRAAIAPGPDGVLGLDLELDRGVLVEDGAESGRPGGSLQLWTAVRYAPTLASTVSPSGETDSRGRPVRGTPMGSARTRCQLAMASVVALLGSLVLAGPGSALDCDITFPVGGGSIESLTDGQVACGGPGADRIETMEGGVFLGRGGEDRVVTMNGGKFVGGPDYDAVYYLEGGRFHGGGYTDQVLYYIRDGRFVGGTGNDRVEQLDGGVFKGGPGDDRVAYLAGGTFYGAAGADFAAFVYGTGVFRAGRGPDTVMWLRDGGKFNGARGNDRVTEYLQDATFNGGAGRDTAKVADCSTTEVLTGVEKVSTVPCQ